MNGKNSLFWLAAAGVALYFAFQKGYLAILGLCPAGSTIGQNVLPYCALPGGSGVGMQASGLPGCLPPCVIVQGNLGASCMCPPKGSSLWQTEGPSQPGYWQQKPVVVSSAPAGFSGLRGLGAAGFILSRRRR